jgi:hypothetical protein
MSDKVTIGLLNKCQKVLQEAIEKKRSQKNNEMDPKAIEQLAWATLGVEDKYLRKLELEQELKDLNRELWAFNGGSQYYSATSHRHYKNCSSTELEDALVAARETLILNSIPWTR